MKIIQTILMLLMTILLMACNVVLVIDANLVKKAIELQISLSQQEVYQQFTARNSRPTLTINGVKISEVKSLNLDHLPTFSVKGTYDIQLQYPQQKILRKNHPYRVYLQEQQEGKTWRLLRPQNSYRGKDTIWLTYLLE